MLSDMTARPEQGADIAYFLLVMRV